MASTTTISTKAIVIVGGGLAGLTAAYHLHRNGLDFTLVEARERLGGRILTADPQTDVSHDGFDLGPSWLARHASVGSGICTRVGGSIRPGRAGSVWQAANSTQRSRLSGWGHRSR
ncbi:MULTISPECIES: FAD-dependent oxidoreductase [Rhizobium]|uniref:FAD-dependent oxidoreductase n=1 Tax=Rhizobium TaxID=379 RepID=UPI000EA936D0|nr:MULTISPECIES: FAD-dependent oxidoreductase [Rhizobium]AYG70378.1 FAD-dependent oxidoreductase [Rhizobium sp. CCGE531]AYG76780.1 FAD-dependent oxidoreductase [Rhizobium sp. CCGE532]MDK4743736.1 FAD-dependent oxidoreductase [Rhizobium sp. CNPSo 3464]